MSDRSFTTTDVIEVELRDRRDGSTRRGLLGIGGQQDDLGHSLISEVVPDPEHGFRSVGHVEEVSDLAPDLFSERVRDEGLVLDLVEVPPAQAGLAVSSLPAAISSLQNGDHVFVHDRPSPRARTIESVVTSTDSPAAMVEVSGGHYNRVDGVNIGAADTTVITSATALDGSRLRSGRDWAKENDITVLDPDGWRRTDGRGFDDPISEVDFADRVMVSTVQADDPRVMKRLVGLLDEHGLNERTGEMSSRGPLVVDPEDEIGWGREVPLAEAQLQEDRLEQMRDHFTGQLEELEKYIDELNPHNPEMKPKIDGGRRALEHGRQMMAELEEPMSGVPGGVSLETLAQVSNRTDTYLEKIGARPQQSVPIRRGAGVDVPLEDQPIVDDCEVQP